MLRCCLCQSLGASHQNAHDGSRLEPLLDHAIIHTAQIKRFTKTNIFKIFADCFPKLAADYTLREIVDSMEASQSRGSYSSGCTEEKTASVPAKGIEEVPRRQDSIFVKDTGKRSPIDKQGKRSSCKPAEISIRSQIRKTLEAFCDTTQRRFRCDVCYDLIVLRTSSEKSNGFNTWCAIDHVLSRHMDIKPFRCRHCDFTTACRSSITHHVKVVHKASDYRLVHFIHQINAHQKEICEMVKTCFGKKQRNASQSGAQAKINSTKQYEDTALIADDNGNQSTACDAERSHSHGHPMIGALCQRIAALYNKGQHRFECGICGKLVVLRSTGSLHSNLALQHAVSHMDIKPFRCRYCTVAMKSQSHMCYHVKSAHKLPTSSSIYYINEIPAHEKEICEMITLCFGKKDKPTSGITKSVEINLKPLEGMKDDLDDF